MPNNINRRSFLEKSAAGAAALSILSSNLFANEANNEKPIRVGIVGTGRRGPSLMRTMLNIPDIQVTALCDINYENLQNAQKILVDNERPRADEYFENEHSFEKLMQRDDLDAVIIATPWNWHTPMAVYAMKQGKYAGIEVPAAITFEDCYNLVKTHEETGVPCMMLENWSFRRDNLAVLNMIRQDLLGDIVHCHCAHSHDCVDHWFFDMDGNKRWGADFLINRNCDQYPTHSVGPVISWMDIGCGDYFDYITSTATDSKGINAHFARKFGPDHPNTKQIYKQGDIVTSTIRTKKGKTLIINYDMQLPRPYDNRWLIQGTKGLYNEQRDAVYFLDKSPEYHEWEPFPPYQEKYDHFWYTDKEWIASIDHGHGGTDFLELTLFFHAVRNKIQTPIDAYDSAIMSAIVPLSEKSIAENSAPVKVPDFTHGKWESKKPTFGVKI